MKRLITNYKYRHNERIIINHLIFNKNKKLHSQDIEFILNLCSLFPFGFFIWWMKHLKEKELTKILTANPRLIEILL